MLSSRRCSFAFALLLCLVLVCYFWRDIVAAGPPRLTFRPKPHDNNKSEPAADASQYKEEEAAQKPTAPDPEISHPDPPSSSSSSSSSFRWSQVPQHYPVSSFAPLPSGGDATALPRIQHAFRAESADARATRQARLGAVRGNFTRAWHGYRQYAWLKDEVGPLSGQSFDHFGGWAASLVDGLDTLWIMGLRAEFDEAVDAIRAIDFSSCALGELNVFETVIRYMGGLLGAYDLSGGAYPVLLRKAEELGEMVYKAFDTPNRMPITRWDFHAAKRGEKQLAPDNTLVAEIGSLSLELTRLAQLTGENRYYDAIKRITDHFVAQQSQTELPGLFPVVVNPRRLDFKSGNLFTLGGMVDSLYEYLPKAHLLLHGATDSYKDLYLNALKPIQEHLIYKPMTPDERDIRIAGQASVSSHTVQPEPQAQHLTCFTGGMVALGARAFPDPAMLRLGRQLTDGCTWAYEVMPQGIMPEIMHTTRCPAAAQPCPWDDSIWHSAVDSLTPGAEHVAAKIQTQHLPPGVAAVDDTRYGLRPEAIESVFVLWRLTGDVRLQETAWGMFQSIVAATATDIGAAALSDCVDVGGDHRTDRMESFWLAETLKYFYLVFAEPEVVSLDEFVLNTEAHPFRYRTLAK